MIALVVAICIGEILTALEVACAVTAVLIALGRIGDHGSIEGTMVNPATLDGSSECRALLLTLHTNAILGNVLKGDVSHLKAPAVSLCIVGCLADEVNTPSVNYSISTDTLDSDILTARHTSHKAVVTYRAAVVNTVILCKSRGRSYPADNTNNERGAVGCKLSKNVGVAVGLTALRALAAANVHTNRV